MLLRGLTWLVLFQLLGTAINVLFLSMLPGPIIGMLLLFVFLLVNGEVGEPLSVAASGLLRYLPLLLVPLMAFTGLAVDVGGWYARGAQLQRAADAAALAGWLAAERARADGVA